MSEHTVENDASLREALARAIFVSDDGWRHRVGAWGAASAIDRAPYYRNADALLSAGWHIIPPAEGGAA